MLLAVDVDYRKDGSAVSAGIIFEDWPSGTIENILIRHVTTVEPYEAGRFFERELPCILAVLDDCPDRPKAIVIDGYAVLGRSRRAGLGAHLFRELEGTVPVIGVAKTRFRDTPAATEVRRGDSARPLFVTSVGICESLARERVRSMHGHHRIPTILAAADLACRMADPDSSTVDLRSRINKTLNHSSLYRNCPWS